MEAIVKYGAPEIFNTDQESQFTSDEFTNILKTHGVKISMDGKGRVLDNIFDAKLKTVKYVEVYNLRRFHSSLNYKTLNEIYFKNLPKEVCEFKQCLKNMS